MLLIDAVPAFCALTHLNAVGLFLAELTGNTCPAYIHVPQARKQ